MGINDEVRKSMNALKKLFMYLPKDTDKDYIPTDKLVGYMDRTNCIMVIPKTYFLKTTLVNEFGVSESTIPELNYNDKEHGGYYTIELLKLITPLLINTTSDGFDIYTAKEYPITLETKEVKIIVAPRIKNE